MLLGIRKRMETVGLNITKPALYTSHTCEDLTSLYVHVGWRSPEEPDHHVEVGDLVEAGDQHAEQEQDPTLTGREI